MIFVLFLSPEKNEIEKIRADIRYLAAMHTDEEMEFHLFRTEKEFREGMKNVSFLHMAVVDVTLPGGPEAARELRRRYPEVQILVLSDISVSPVLYLTPDIRPSSLLLRPYDDDMRYKTLKDFFFLSIKPLLTSTDQYFWIKTRDGTQRIPYEAILYFEAREKRVFVRTRTVEYGTGGTIEKTAENLPQNFIRCHRSFIINRDYIDRIRLSEGTVYMAGSIMVPISRSYKADLKEYASGNKAIM